MRATNPISHTLGVYGCRAYVHIPKERGVRSEKFRPRGHTGKLVGYKGSTIYKVYVYERDFIVEIPHVWFDESKVDDWPLKEKYRKKPYTRC